LLKDTSKVKYRPEALEDKDKDHKIDTIDKDTESGSGGGTVHDVGALFSNGVGGTPANLDCLPALYPSLDLYPKVLFSAKNF
jgi:hypothetical protein